MRKAIILIAILVIGLMIAGCGAKAPADAPPAKIAEPDVTPELDVEEMPEEEMDAVEEDEDAVDPADLAEDGAPEDEPEVEPEEPVEEAPVIRTLSQSDLDRLGEDLEGMEFDDLGGLTE